MLYLDAGTTYSKIITDDKNFDNSFFQYEKNDKNYYILPSNIIKEFSFEPNACCGHMSNANENEIIALAQGAQKYGVDENATVLDLGSRDSKWIKFKDNKFQDMDWNTSCASSTGATVEMLLKFYDIKLVNLKFTKEKYNITCGIFGMEKIMDDISNGESPEKSVSKFVHGIAYNAWNFCKQPEKIYLSGGFCENKCLVDSLKNYCEVELLGRFVLCEGLF